MPLKGCFSREKIYFINQTHPTQIVKIKKSVFGGFLTIIGYVKSLNKKYTKIAIKSDLQWMGVRFFSFGTYNLLRQGEEKNVQ